MICLSFGVARQHKTARDDPIALLPIGSSRLKYYKHNISDVLVYKAKDRIAQKLLFFSHHVYLKHQKSNSLKE